MGGARRNWSERSVPGGAERRLRARGGDLLLSLAALLCSASSAAGEWRLCVDAAVAWSDAEGRGGGKGGD